MRERGNGSWKGKGFEFRSERTKNLASKVTNGTVNKVATICDGRDHDYRDPLSHR